MTARFFGYVIPAAFALMLSGVYAIADGFFVGNRMGDIGLSAINFAFPVSEVLTSLGAGIGMGGAVHYAIEKGRRAQDRAETYARLTMAILLLLGLVVSFFVYITAEPLLVLMGASGTLLSLGTEYNRIIALGGWLQIVGTGMIPLLRNIVGSASATGIMVLGFSCNIFLDWLFVWIFDWGIAGAALATVLGQAVAAIFGIGFFWRKISFFTGKDVSGCREMAQDIGRVALAPFGITMTPVVSLAVMNGFCAHYGGAEAVAVYAVIAYVTCMAYFIFQGIGEGSQPLMSLYFGKRDGKTLAKIRRLAFGTALLSAFGSAALLWAAGGDLFRMMGVSENVALWGEAILPIFLVAFPFIAYARVSAAIFYAVKQNHAAQCLAYAEPFLLLAFLLILPSLAGENVMDGVWWSLTAARIATAALAFCLLHRQKRWECGSSHCVERRNFSIGREPSSVDRKA